MKKIILCLMFLLFDSLCHGEAVVLNNREDNSAAEINRLVINIPSFELFACYDKEIIKIYKVTLGRIGLPTPEGTFIIDRKSKDQPYVPLEGSPNKKIADYFPPGDNNPMGTRRMHFYGHIYIHGVPQVKRYLIGKTKGGSCVGLLKEDIEELYDKVEIDTPVEIYYRTTKILTKQNLSVGIEKYPDLYNGYRKIVTNPSIYPEKIKKIPVLEFDVSCSTNVPVDKWDIEETLLDNIIFINK